MTQQRDYLSAEKYKELEKELEYLKTDGRLDVAGRLEYAKSLGDLSENAEYGEAREAFNNLELRIADIENLLKTATIVKAQHSIRVEIGSKVLVERDGADAKWYSVVGSRDADVLKNKISNESPMGAAMLGKKKGDSFVVKTPRGSTTFVIKDLE